MNKPQVVIDYQRIAYWKQNPTGYVRHSSGTKTVDAKVVLSIEEAKFARKLGGGYVSRGLRRALQAASEC